MNMDRLTDSAQGYCEMYCENYGIPGCDPETCARKGEVAMYERLKDVEGIVPFDRLVELAFADRAGLAKVLPCKVGDTVYTNVAIRGDKYKKANRPYHVKVVFIGMGEHSAYFNVAYDNGRVFPFDFDQIGKDVFLTLESAEAMLEKEAHEDSN